MKVLQYNDLNIAPVKKQFIKSIGFLQNNDFHSAEIKKITNSDYYRAKLDYENRLLFKFAKFQDETYILLLEVILNHAYEKSKFLNGAKVDENKLAPLQDEKKIPDADKEVLRYVNTSAGTFHLLDKIISFDEIQSKIFSLPPPVIIVGSAGSGKTVLTLEKIKQLKGSILYITLSPYLAENSSKLYFSNHYENEKQEIDFLNYKEFLETIRILQGREFDRSLFNEWIQTRKHIFKIKDTYKLFEEFKGVLTGLDISRPYLSQEEYLNLGVKQSIFLGSERENVYEAFRNYLEYMKEKSLIDLNIVSFQYQVLCKPRYDFIVIDEVQDFTNIQLYLVLKSLKTERNFMLCGDSNQIVHPNFFSWTNLKTMFYKHDLVSADIKILRTNYRNSVDVTRIANRLLMLKNARFGSLDKESAFLVDTISENKGEVRFYRDTPKIRSQFNEKTHRSAKYAVLVLNPEDKAEVRKSFRTPLLFSIHEAKGLEYENIILINFVSNSSREFINITRGITEKDMDPDSFTYARSRDKADKDLDAYKFYINALYVGMTRAVKNLFIIESSVNHDIFRLLLLVEKEEQTVTLKTDASTAEEWQEEARKLEMQGKNEQAEEIRKSILNITKPDWVPITPENLPDLKEEALNPETFNKKAKDKLFAYALLYDDFESIAKLSELKYRKADNFKAEKQSVFRKHYGIYLAGNVKAVEENIRKYGADYRDEFNQTPLLAAINTGNRKIAEYLLKIGVNMDVADHLYRNPQQILLARAYHDLQYFARMEALYPLCRNDFVKIKVNDQLIKVDNKKMEYFLIHFFIALQQEIIQGFRRKYELDGVSAPDLERILQKFPESVLPEYRKRRQYISAMLAKNEVESENPYNRMLFLRSDRGLYVLQPELEVMVEGKWKNVYDIMRSPKPRKMSFLEKELFLIKTYISELEKDKREIQGSNKPFDSSFIDQMIFSHQQRYDRILKMLHEQTGQAPAGENPVTREPKAEKDESVKEKEGKKPGVKKENREDDRQLSLF
ncbi:MAG: hypothetical protein JXA03_05525 [Bacteroidales bacterium]|nr:hypothetical protein [Bacteroidales bacterium]